MSQVRRKFQFLRLVASGGFGDVYLCKEQESGLVDWLQLFPSHIGVTVRGGFQIKR